MERASKRLQKSFARLQLPITSVCAAGGLFTKIVTRLVAVLAIFLLAAPAAHAWWDLTWDARIQLTFDNSGQTENLIDFPVLVALDPSNIDYGQLEPNGEDLRFVDADDATLLMHEIESWNPGGISYVWVRVPQIDGLSSTDFIYLYYDKTGAPDVQDSAGVWSADYLAVWHLDDDPTGAASVLDSTGNAKHGSGSASMSATNVVAGQIGQATTFDGSADYIRVPSGAGDVLEINGENITIEAWARRNGSTAGNIWMALVGRQFGAASTPDSYVQLLDLNDPSLARFAVANGLASSASGAVPDLTWRYLAATKDASFIRQYVSGSQTGQVASGGPIFSDPNDVTIGAMENDATAVPTEWYVGDLDEIRISSVTRSADWIAAQHLSMTQSFVTFDFELSGTVFEDANFAGTASDYDGGINGVEVLEHIKQVSPRTHVIMITSHASLDTSIDAIKHGAYDYLQKPFEDLSLISSAARRAVDAYRLDIERSQLIRSLKLSNKELARVNGVLHGLAVRDGLTELYNHRYVNEMLDKHIDKSTVEGMDLSLIFIDVDHFKIFNDDHGHQTGDVLLRELSALMRENVRTKDIVARWGGEEFVIVCPTTNEETASRLAESLRATIAQHHFVRNLLPTGPQVTISAGVASLAKTKSKAVMLAAADSALYVAKDNGRNQVRAA